LDENLVEEEVRVTKIKKIPTGEKLQVTCNSPKGVFYITRKNDSTKLFFLYKEEKDKTLERLDKGRKNPMEFDKLIW
jgi:cold shock CspA family protein